MLSRAAFAARVASRNAVRRAARPALAFHSGRPAESAADESAEMDKIQNPGPGLIDSLGLKDWKKWVPTAAATIGALTATGVYHIDAETQIVLCTALFAATVYDQAGREIGSSLDAEIEAEWKVHEDADRKVVADMESLVQQYRDAATLHADFAGLSAAVVSAAKTSERLREVRYRHAVRNAVAAALEQQLQSERRASATLQRQIVSEGIEAVRQYFASAEHGGELADDAVFVGTVRMETQDFAPDTVEEAKADYSGSDLVDPVHRAFYSYLHHRLAAAKANAAKEVAEVEVPLLEKLVATTDATIRATLPAGIDFAVEPLPAIQVQSAPSASRAMDVVASINDKVFSQPIEQVSDIDVASLDWADPNADAPEVSVDIYEDGDGERTLTMFLADEDGDDTVPAEAAIGGDDEYEYEYEEEA